MLWLIEYNSPLPNLGNSHPVGNQWLHNKVRICGRGSGCTRRLDTSVRNQRAATKDAFHGFCFCFAAAVRITQNAFCRLPRLAARRRPRNRRAVARRDFSRCGGLARVAAGRWHAHSTDFAASLDSRALCRPIAAVRSGWFGRLDRCRDIAVVAAAQRSRSADGARRRSLLAGSETTRRRLPQNVTF